jgi:phosphatidylglycerophosphate synthase
MSFTQKRDKFMGLEIKTGGIFSKIPLSPNQYTLISLALVLPALYFLINANFLLAAFFYVLAVFFDFVDGAVARTSGKATKIGAYLDTICDRYVEGIFLLGFLTLSLSSFGFGAEIWIGLCLFGSLMTTYAKAAAKEKELTQKELKKGWFQRPERAILILLSLILASFNVSFLIYPIIILAILSNFTALQRIYLTIRTQNVH